MSDMERHRRRLHVWNGEMHTGFFEVDGGRAVSFSYDPSYHGPPISLSLPLDAPPTSSAPAEFLENLVPEGEGMRFAQMVRIGAASTSPPDLLDACDASGGLTFSYAADPPRRTALPLRPAYDIEIAAQLASSPRFDDPFEGTAANRRFSLAGAQPKISLSEIAGDWYWPCASLPSTHILKPDAPRAPSSSKLEHIGMSLADAAGVPAAGHSLVRFGDAEAYITRRFDRAPGADGIPVRLLAEDLVQALGLFPKDKYDVEIDDAIGVLQLADPDEELCYTFFEQLALAVAVGNCDAHAKNFSLLLSDGVELAPMYDVVPTVFWDDFDDGLAMPLGLWREDTGGTFFSRFVTFDDWALEAERHGLDGYRVASRAREISTLVVDAAPELAAGLSPAERNRLVSRLLEANRSISARRGGNADVYSVAEPCRRPSDACNAVLPDDKKTHSPRGKREFK